MEQHIVQTVETLKQEVTKKEKELNDTKRVVNSLCRNFRKWCLLDVVNLID